MGSPSLHDNLFTPGEIHGSRPFSLPGKFSDQWIEETIQCDFEKKEEQHFIGNGFGKKQMLIIAIGVITIFFVIIARLMYVQILSGNMYRVHAEGNRQRLIPIVSERGLIYDRNGKVLTKNIPNFSLVIIPQDLPRSVREKEDTIGKLADLVHIAKEDILLHIEEYAKYKYESITIAEDLDYDTALRIYIASADLPGVHIQQGSKRLYECNDTVSSSTLFNTTSTATCTSLSHVLGYVGKISPEELEELYQTGYLPSDSVGKMGVENTFEQVLRGTYGRKRIEVNATGKEQGVLAEEEPIPGTHLELSIDREMQQKLEEIVKHHIQLRNKRRASAIVIDPRNGEVLAMVNVPDFDNNNFSGGIDSDTYTRYISDENRPLFNRAIGGLYPSGSTIKIAMASAGLQEKIITPNTTVLSTGGVAVGSWFFPDWNPGGHGITDVRKSIAWSINTFYYILGGGYGEREGLGIYKIHDYLSRFGFGNKLSIDLPGEAAGLVPDPEWKRKVKDEPWYIGDTYNLSIGQGDLLVTPLQIANMTATVANGGTLYRPHVVKTMINPMSGERTEIEIEKLREQVIDDTYLSTVRWGMRDCVTVGSCARLSRLPFAAAGKSGTAQWNRNKDNHAWFTSFAPFEHPEIVVTILMEEGGEGGIVSTPIAYEFYDWWWKYKGYDKH